MGDANASIPTPRPVAARSVFGAASWVAAASSRHFVAPEAIEGGLADRLGTLTPMLPVASTRRVTEADMIGNDALIEPAPAEELPMVQRYFLY